MRRILCLGLLAACGTGCGTTPNRPVHAVGPAGGVAPGPAPGAVEPATGTAELGPGRGEAADEGPAAVAFVAGQPILTSELLGAWLHRESRSVRAYLEELILSRLVMLEAGRLGVRLPDSALDEALSGATDRLRQEVVAAGGTSVESFLEARLGLNPTRYLAVLREQTAIDLYAARVVRAWLLSSERAEVRVIVTEDEQAATAARAALDGGEAFADVARRYSIEAGAGEGGRVPPVVRGPTAMAHLAFSTPIGSVGGPAFEGGRWLLLRVDGRPAPIDGDWDTLGPAVEASLAAQAIEDPEYWQWKGWALERYEVDMQPFLDLTGGALVE